MNSEELTSSAKLIIISVYYNREQLVHDSVGSVAEQLTDDMRLLLVDDGSTDGTYNELVKWRGPRISAITSPNRGFVHTIVHAIRDTYSEYIGIHGSGDTSLPTRFAKQMRVLDSDPSIGVVGCLVLQRSNDWVHSRQTFGSAFSGDARHILLERNLFTHGEVMMRRAVYEQAGGYRTYFKFSQDLDLWCRMSTLTKFHVINEVLYERLAATVGSVSGTPEKMVLQRYLSNLAVFCHKERLAGRPDPLEKHGPHCAFYVQRSAGLRRKFLLLLVQAVGGKNERAALLFADAYRREGGMRLVARVLLALVRARAAMFIASPLLKRAVVTWVNR